MVSFNDIQSKRDVIIDAAVRHGAHNVRIFGSVARGENSSSSDIDFLVEMDEKSSLFDQAELLYDLEQIFGCKVDVVDQSRLHSLIRDRILAESRPL